MYVLKQLHSRAAGPANCSIKCHQDPQKHKEFFLHKKARKCPKRKETRPTKGKEKTQGKNARKQKGKEILQVDNSVVLLNHVVTYVVH